MRLFLEVKVSLVMKTNNKLLLLVLTHNCLNYTKRLFATTVYTRPHLWYFADNASAWDTKEWLLTISSFSDVLVTYHAQNRGVAKGWNCALDFAFSCAGIEVAAVLNNDSLLHSKALSLMLEVIESGKYHFVTATDVSGEVSRPEDVFNLDVPADSSFTEAPDFSCFMLDRFCWEKVGKFDESFYPAYFEDNDYHYRAKLAKMPLVKYNRALYFHYGSRTLTENKTVRDLVSKTYLGNKGYFIQKWGGEPGKEKFVVPFDGKGGVK